MRGNNSVARSKTVEAVTSITTTFIEFVRNEGDVE